MRHEIHRLLQQRTPAQIPELPHARKEGRTVLRPSPSRIRGFGFVRLQEIFQDFRRFRLGPQVRAPEKTPVKQGVKPTYRELRGSDFTTHSTFSNSAFQCNSHVLPRWQNECQSKFHLWVRPKNMILYQNLAGNGC